MPTLLLLTLGTSPWASDAVRGDEFVHAVPGGTRARCVMLARLPGGHYRAAEEAAQRAYDYWVLGRGADEHRRRRSVLHDVLGWGRKD